MNRHKGLEWPKVKARLEARAEKLWSLSEMERTAGETSPLRFIWTTPRCVPPSGVKFVISRRRSSGTEIVRGEVVMILLLNPRNFEVFQ
jgi:hypothetical protein